jgi:hypothetical protein
MQYPMIAQPQYAFAPTMMAKGGAVDAENVRAQGRNNDSMLVHMTPREVGGLQALAMQHGGSLTINPKTGLPEANFLENILPTLLGVGGMFLGIPPHLTALAVGGIQTARTGDLGKGLMAGLGAFGGAQLGGALGAAGGAGAAGAAGAAPTVAPTELLRPEAFAGKAIPSYVPADVAIDQAVASLPASAPTAAPGFVSNAAQAGRGFQNLVTGQPGAFDKFIGTAASPTAEATGLGGMKGAAKTAGMIAAPAMAPKTYKPPKEEKSTYEGPYTPTPRDVRFPTAEELNNIGTSEFQYFADVNPVPGFQPFSATQTAQSRSGVAAPVATPMMTEEERRQIAALGAQGFAPFNKGGSVPQLESGGFVLTKKAIDGLGKGDNKKGQQVASAGLGAIPIRGRGTGTSDSIKTSIDGRMPARVSNGEAYVPKDKVKRGGGAKKFYALMKKAERAAA